MSQLIKEIKNNWKLEAKSENTERYFFHVEEADGIVSGRRCYVIGRKGTGKTALSEYIAQIRGHDKFSEKLSFKNFPFNELYALQNKGYTAPNQYITIWKYIIYSFICKMMSRNQAIDSEVRDPLVRLYAPEPVSQLNRWIRKWTAKEFQFNILGSGGKVGGDVSQNSSDWVEKVEALENVISRYIDDSTYYVIFDELDEDYKNIMEKEQYKSYTELLTGLFKAVQDIKSTFRGERFRIRPIIFLRDDIYSLITDPDKTKWDDYKIELEWDKRKIKELLAFRISRAISPGSAKPLLFAQAWDKLFVDHPVMYGHRQESEMSIFDYITRSTHLRPRDYIKYLQVCADAVPDGESKVHPRIVKSVDKSFSNYLKRELIDEIHGAVQEIDQVLGIISQIRKQTFSIAEFSAAYEDKVKKGAITDIGVDFLLKMLFLFSVIGNQPKQKNRTVFRYIDKDAELNYSEPIVVHRGLYKALQIL